MNKASETIWQNANGHLSEDDLRLYADGECEAAEAARVKRHLEACWSCRIESDKAHTTIAEFIEYRNQLLRPLAPPAFIRLSSRAISATRSAAAMSAAGA